MDISGPAEQMPLGPTIRRRPMAMAWALMSAGPDGGLPDHPPSAA